MCVTCQGLSDVGAQVNLDPVGDAEVSVESGGLLRINPEPLVIFLVAGEDTPSVPREPRNYILLQEGYFQRRCLDG